VGLATQCSAGPGSDRALRVSGFVLDHVYAFCRPGAPEAARLEAAGLRIGVRREHPGQGTANVCFCFQDSYLELIWITDVADAAAAALALPERSRWRESTASPFGICLRPAGDPAAAPPFAAVDYAPAYLPPGMPPIRIAVNPRAAAEPLLFALARDYVPPAVAHVLAQSRVSKARFTVPRLSPASPLSALGVENLSVVDGPHHLLELEFSGGSPGATVDLHPELPLVLRW
jgi:hypothetical protein